MAMLSKIYKGRVSYFVMLHQREIQVEKESNYALILIKGSLN